MRRSHLFSILFPLVLLAACSSWPSFIQSGTNVRIQYPPKWTVADSQPGQTFFNEPAQEASVTLSVQENDTGADTLDAYMGSYLKNLEIQLKSQGLIYTQISSDSTTFGRKPARRITFKMSGKNEVQGVFVTTVFKGRVYTLSYSAQPDLFEKHLASFEKMMASVKLP